MTSDPTTRRARLAWVALSLVVAWSFAQRLTLIAAGPDPDIDAYAHFVRGRRLDAEWRDLRVHWVWLPLWHYAAWAVTKLGASITALRVASAVASATTCFTLTALLRDHVARVAAPWPWLRDAEQVIPFAAGAALALWPLNLLVGASAEPEAFFQLALVAACLAWSRRRFALAGVALSLAALTRYEAWTVLPVFVLAWWPERRAPRAALVWALPAATVLLWCVAHGLATSAPLGFLRENRAYVGRAWRDFDFDARMPEKLVHPWRWYAWQVPWLSLKRWMVAVVVGAPWLVARAPRSFTAAAALLLAVVTVVWVTRANLGLERHFAAMIPAYATAFAAGVVAPAAWVASRRRASLTYGAAVAAALVAGVLFARGRVRRWEALHTRHSVEAYVSERAAAAALRARIAPGARLFTDDQRVEVFSGLAPERVVRWTVSDVRDFNLLVEASRRGEVWVASAPSRLTQLRDDVETVWSDRTIALVRRRAPAVLDAALAREPDAW